MNTLSGKYWLGEPVQYGSIYGYQKFKYPVFNDSGKVGEIKEEKVLDGDGNVVAATYYTRSLSRPHGAHRFYETPTAMILAFGGAMDRTKGKQPVPAKLPRLKVAAAKKPRTASTPGPKPRVKKVA